MVAFAVIGRGVEDKVQPSLLFVPSAIQVVVPLVVTVVLLAAAVVVATVALIRSARPELLREAPP